MACGLVTANIGPLTQTLRTTSPHSTHRFPAANKTPDPDLLPRQPNDQHRLTFGVDRFSSPPRSANTLTVPLYYWHDW